MASVVFLRGVNVGGHKAFRPSVLASRLSALGVVSIGAAGTFVVRSDADEDKIRGAFRKHLPFEAMMMICPAQDVVDLLKRDPFGEKGLPKVDGQFISAVEKRPRKIPSLPLSVPEGRDWQVRVIDVHGCFIATLMRRIGRTPLYPNEVVEKRLGVAATTRGWPTFLKVRRAMDANS